MEAAIPRARVFASLLQRQFFKGILACSAAALSLSRVSPLSFLTLPSSLAHSPLPCYRVTRLSRTCIPWSSASSDNISVAPVTLLLLHVDKCLKDSTTFHNPEQPSILPSSLFAARKRLSPRVISSVRGNNKSGDGGGEDVCRFLPSFPPFFA